MELPYLIFDDEIQNINRFFFFENAFVVFLPGGIFGFKKVIKLVFLQSFNIRSLKLDANDNFPLDHVMVQ